MDSNTSQELSTQLIDSTDIAETEKLITTINAAIKKRAVIRADVLSQLQDKITDEISDRITHRSAEFSNADLLNYMNTLQTLVDKTDTSTDIPAVAIQTNNTINIGTGSDLDRNSRDKIKFVIDKLLKDKEITDG